MSYLITTGRYAGMTAKQGNRGGPGGALAIPAVVTTFGVPPVAWLHEVPLGRSFYVTKIMWYNPGVLATLNFGTLSNAAIPVPVPMFPTQMALPGLVDGLTEEELVGVEFMLNSLAAPNGWDGNLYVVASIVAIELSVEVAEKA